MPMICYLTLLLLVPLSAVAKKNICTATINSKQEREVFQSKLNPQDFNFIELTDYTSDKKSSKNDWFENACEAKVECDVLIISGHFGGSFFGDTEYSLGLNELENRSCHKRCSGILEKPKEVYLFGCNTLASKEKDHRSPQDYYRALVEHEIEPVEAERIVSARYSPIGFSNKERMERIFEAVPLIYGFSSVGPSGRNIKSSLIKYLDSVGDYKTHLKNIENGHADPAIFLRQMLSYTTVHSKGIDKASAHYDVKENSCKLTDDKINLEDRVAFAGEILEKSPYVYFPTVSHFINSNFSSNYISDGGNDYAQKNLVKLTAKIDLKDQILKIFNAGGFGPGMQMDLLSFSRTVRWLSEVEFKEKALKLFDGLFKEPSLANSDIFCSIQDEHDGLMKSLNNDLVNQLSRENLSSPYILKALSCLDFEDNPETRNLGEKVFKSIRGIELSGFSIELRFTLLTLLTDIPMEDDDQVLPFLMNIPRATSGRYYKEFNDYLPILFLKKMKGDEQTQFLKKLIFEAKGNNEKLDSIFYVLHESKNLTAESETIYLNYSFKQCKKSDNCWIYGFTGNPHVQDWVVQYLKLNEKPYFLNALCDKMVLEQHIPTSRMVNAILSIYTRLTPAERSQNNLMLQVLAKANLSSAILGQLYQTLLAIPYYKTTSEVDPAAIKHVLYLNKDNVPGLNPADLAGQKLKTICQKTGSNSSGCNWEYYTE